VVFTVRVDPNGIATLDGAERALIRSRAKLGYETVHAAQLPDTFAAFAERIHAAEDRRGAARVEVPEQEVSQSANGHFTLRFRPRVIAEDQNATLSLACNLAVAQAMLRQRTGLFRVMAGPDARAEERLRNTARAYGLYWPGEATLAQFQRMLDTRDPKQAAFAQAIHRAGSGARYQPYEEGVIPWHAAVAASYAHATAPLRRLADRYVVRAALAIANGQAVPAAVEEAFSTLPKVMARAEGIGGRIDRAVIDLAETVALDGREGERFPALVTDVDERGARIQLCDLPVVARIATDGLLPGDPLTVRLAAIDQRARLLRFEPPGETGDGTAR
jgi:exoribonuclease R